MILIKDLTKYYGEHLGCLNVALKIDDGQAFGLVGPNGAGKTTIIKCMMGLIEKSSGEIIFDDKPVSIDNYKLKRQIGYLPAEIHLYEDLTVKKHLEYSDSFYLGRHMDNAAELCSRLKLDMELRIDELSLGNLKKVGIVLALMHDPKYIIMDEATSGLDPLMQEEFFNILKEAKSRGRTIFFSTHILSEISKICDVVGVIKQGTIIKLEKVDDMLSDVDRKVHIESDELDKLNFHNILLRKDNEIDFVFSGNVNELIRQLSGINVKQLYIEEPSLEEVFMKFYK